MIRNLLATGVAVAMLTTPLGAIAQQLVPGDSILTYSDTLPRHGSVVKSQVALKASSKKSGSKGHKSGKSHQGSGKHHG